MPEHSLLPAPFRVIARDNVGSTNDEARRLAEDGAAADFVVVTAREQSAGRGRRGRAWISPPGNLHCSLLLAAPRLDVAAQLGFVAAVALVDALAGLVPGVEFRCKWPNDVLANGRKVAGMLLEPAGSGWLVLGLGVDVAVAPPDDAVMHPAVALAGLGYGGDADSVLAAFCGAVAPWVARWRAEGFAPLRSAWMERAHGLGRSVEVRLDAGSETGVFAGLDDDGALLLDRDGGRRRIMAGDVLFPPASAG
jgi:BirA family biotin operon repressor/biotin-[acetyl-CoA-carboxylase] ligase